MKRIALTCAFAALVSVCTSASAGNWTWDASTGVYGRNIFRGARLGGTSLISEGTLTCQLTPRLSVSGRGLNATNLTAPQGMLENRLDVYLRYKPWKNVGLVGGWLYFDHNAAHGLGPDTAEIYGGLETKYFGLNPSIYGFYDYDQNVGLYLVGTVSKSFTLGRSGWTMDTLGAIGFDFGRNDSLQNGLLSFDLNYPLARGLEVGPRLDVHFPTNVVAPGANGCQPSLGFGFNYSGAF